MACGFNIFQREHNLVQNLEFVVFLLIDKIFYFSPLLYKVEIMVASASMGNADAFYKKNV